MSTPYETTRYRCDFCRRSYAAKSKANKHEAACWHNPASHSCFTCTHYHPENWPKVAFCALGVTGWAYSSDPDDNGAYQMETQCDAWAVQP